MAISTNAAAVWPLVHAMKPSAAVLSISNTEIDDTPMAPEQRITIKWRGQPVFT